MQIEFKMAKDGFSGLYRIDNKGAWKTEYNMDSMLHNGTFEIAENGRVVGKWVQGTLGHFIRLITN